MAVFGRPFLRTFVEICERLHMLGTFTISDIWSDAVAKETEFEVRGFILVLLATVMSGFRWTLTQLLLQVLQPRLILWLLINVYSYYIQRIFETKRLFLAYFWHIFSNLCKQSIRAHGVVHLSGTSPKLHLLLEEVKRVCVDVAVISMI